MNYITFRERFHGFACFSNEQVVAAFPRFDRGNYSTWLEKGYIKRLRRSWYAFADVAGTPGIGDYFAGRMYSPSYLSCEYVMARAEYVGDGLPVHVATSAKALCDFLYLNSQYDTLEEIEALRLDADVLEEISRDSALDGVVARFGSQALARRIRLVKEVYAI